MLRGFFPQELVKAAKGRLVTWNSSRTVSKFVWQSDIPLPDSVYLLFRNPQNEDALLSELLRHNAAGVIAREPHSLTVDKWVKAGIGIIEVGRVRKAYYDLIALHRFQFDIPVIEVIGSAGKTTTKEMIASIIREKMPVLATYKNANAPFDVAKTINGLEDFHKAAVIEVGMKAPGTITISSNMVRPNIGVITCIQRAHLARLGSINNIINAKAELLKCLPANGLLLVNGDDENCRKLPLDRYKGEIARFGFSNKYDIWAEEIKSDLFKTHFKAKGKDIDIDCSINTFGRYNIANALAAISVGLKLGLSPKEISDGLAKFEPVEGRLKIHEGINGTILIHDNFNANPDSIKMLLDELAHFPESRPIILVLGDMERPGEITGEYSREVHFLAGRQIACLGFYHLIAIGKWAKEYVNGAISGGITKDRVSYFLTVKEAESCLLRYAVPGSIVLFKAAVTYVRMKKLINLLTKGQ